MRVIKAAPLVAILAGTLALAGCGEEQTAETAPPPPAAEAPPAQQPVAEEPVAEQPVAEQPVAEAAPAGDAPMQQTSQIAPGVPQTTLAPPPPPSAIFEAGPDAIAPPDPGPVGALLADAPFRPGVYSDAEFTLELTETGDFTLTRADTGESASGDFRVYGDMMTFSNVGVEAAGVFPMTCRVGPAQGGFQLQADGPSCGMLDGRVFTGG